MNAPLDEHNRRILVIDDNQAICDDFCKILSKESKDSGAEFEEARASLLGVTAAPAQTGSKVSFILDYAHQGQEGLERLRRANQEGRPYALAFVDVRMPPGWDGIETISHLWEEDPCLQVVICTAYSDYSWDGIVRELGQSDRLLLLKKPFDNIEVSQLACALTEKWNLARQAQMRLDELEEAVQRRTRELEEQKLYLGDALARLQETHAELLHAQKLESIGRLAAGIAHEINTPIQYVGDNIRFLGESVNGLLELLSRYRKTLTAITSGKVAGEGIPDGEVLDAEADLPYLVAEIPRAITQGLEGVKRVSEIVLAMRGFAHHGSEEMTLTDLNAAIETTITVSRSEWKYVADLTTDLDQTLPPVLCLAGEFNQVILNLIVNAAQAIGEIGERDASQKGQITVCTHHDGEWAEVRVSDTGPGIPEQVRDRVFDPFFTTKEVGKGTGQGLSIAHSVISEKHGGTIDFETTLGVGTTFIVRLPIRGQDCRGKLENEDGSRSL